jgi:hypothetical protein
MVRGGEDVDCEREGAIEAGVIAGGVGEWHSVAGREDSVADGGGVGGGGERRRVDEQDDGRGDDDDYDDADNDDGPRNRRALYIYDVYV